MRLSWSFVAGRELEEILNTAWASNVECDQWLSYDEQMVKTVSTYASKVSHSNPAKPIKHGENAHAFKGLSHEKGLREDFER